jgi:spermidine synthase
LRGRGAVLAAVVLSGALAWTIAPLPPALVAYGRVAPEWTAVTETLYGGRVLYVGEGTDAFIAVSRGLHGELNYHAAGKVQASTRAEDMRLQLLLAHLSTLVARGRSDILAIGCGAGITAGALALAPDVSHVTIAEIEALVPPAAETYFGAYNRHVVRDPRVTVQLDDGRHYLRTTDQRFDIITTDMVDPWVKGVAALFTKEFFEAAKAHLRPGGVVAQFVQLYQSNEAAVKSEVATFFTVFPHSVVWGNPVSGQGYDLVLLGQAEPLSIDIDEVERRLDSRPFAGVRASLRSIGFDSAVDLFATYSGSSSDLGPWLQDAAINTDRNLRLQYLAGLGVTADDSAAIFQTMLRHARFPPDLFRGSADSLTTLKGLLQGTLGR